MFWPIIGLSAAALTSFSFVSQIIKVVRTRSSKDLSSITLFQFSLGSALWIAYALYLEDAIILMANCVTLASLATLIVLYFHYRRI